MFDSICIEHLSGEGKGEQPEYGDVMMIHLMIQFSRASTFPTLQYIKEVFGEELRHRATRDQIHVSLDTESKSGIALSKCAQAKHPEVPAQQPFVPGSGQTSEAAFLWHFSG